MGEHILEGRNYGENTFRGKNTMGENTFCEKNQKNTFGRFFFVDATGFGKEENTRVHCAVKYVLVLAERVI